VLLSSKTCSDLTHFTLMLCFGYFEEFAMELFCRSLGANGLVVTFSEEFG
jgi:hypothetical protein